MKKEKTETKLCKHCKTEIPSAAKVCPHCRKKQGGKLKVIIIAVIVIGIISAIFGGDDTENVKKTGEVNSNGETEKDDSAEEHNNIFYVGDIIETNDFKITFISASQHNEENQFLQPKEGYEYWKFEFKFENISDSDKTVSSMIDWECYADNSKVDQSWIGDDNGLDATLSAGRTTQGTLYFEIPKDSENIELEYETDFWSEEKVIFVAK